MFIPVYEYMYTSKNKRGNQKPQKELLSFCFPTWERLKGDSVERYVLELV